MNQKIEINDQFKEVLETINHSQKHIFVTGNAGTGKSTLLNYIKRNIFKRHVVLSPTGLSSIHIGGQTIHSFFLFPPNVTMEKARSEGAKRKKDKLFQKLELIIIDEISMVRADLLDAIDMFLRTAKDNISQPFGGVQLVFIGDLFQLPPVLKSDEREEYFAKYQGIFFYHSNVFKQIINYGQDYFRFIELTKIYRQNDPKFIEILNSVRVKRLTNNVLTNLNKNVNNNWESLSNSHIVLTTTNAKSNEINDFNLEFLSGSEKTYNAKIEGDYETKYMPNSKSLSLKVGARVMFVKNDIKKLWQNGSIGTVINLYKDSVEVRLDNSKVVLAPVVEWQITKTQYDEESGKFIPKIVGSYKQIPLKLAWSITIHKSQGQTFDRMILDLDRGAFSAGQTYVALSRCTNLQNLVLARDVWARDIKIDPNLIKFFEFLKLNF